MEKELKKLIEMNTGTLNQKKLGAVSVAEIEFRNYGELFSAIISLIRVSNLALFEIAQIPDQEKIHLMDVYQTFDIATQLVSSLGENEAYLLDNLKNQLTQSN